jgi:hypothetical protein
VTDRELLDERDAEISRLLDKVSELRGALQALLSMPVKGHALQDRLQFSTPGREILGRCFDALKQPDET